jgi:hypothetical protein
MHGIQQVLIGEGFAGAPAEIGLAGIRRLQLEVRQMQFQSAKVAGAQRGLQQAFAFGKVLQDRTALILATPASDGRADDAHQRGRMKRAFEKCDVAKQLPEPGGIGISLGTPALMCQQHDWKIRPRRLAVQPGYQSAQICRLDRLVGDDGQTRAALDLMHEDAEIRTDVRVISRFADQRRSDRRIAPFRREDDGPLGGGPGLTASAPPAAGLPSPT